MKILEEAHGTAYTMHPGSTKMYQDLKEIFCRGAWKEKLQNLCPTVLYVSKWKRNTNSQQVCFSHFLYQSGNESMLWWILLVVYYVLNMGSCGLVNQVSPFSCHENEW